MGVVAGVRVAARRARLLPPWVKRADAAATRRINGWHSHPHVDQFWWRFTGFADKGVLWFTAAGVLAVVGHRRAAARGLLSLITASAVTNLIAKRVFGGDRPALEDVPIGRRLPIQPSSRTFPSGHSASAAAFTAGVALESPRVGAALAPVALGVAYSRLHTGVHWLSDVIGGLAIGVGVAAAGAAIVRPRPGPPPPPVPPGADRTLPAAPDGEGVFIAVNRSAGTSVVRADPIDVLAERLPRAELQVLESDEDPGRAIAAALARPVPPRIVGICGGDGSVACVADEARRAGVPLLIIPAGTFNHFARTAGLASVDAAVDAVQRGEGVRVDLAELTFGAHEPITVTNVASVGVYPDFVAEREQVQRRVGNKWLAAVVAAARVLRRSDPVTVVVDGRRAEVWTLFVGVGRNERDLPAPLQRRTLDDGLLDVRALHAGSRAGAIASLAFGRRTAAVVRALRLVPERVEAFTTTKLTVDVRPRGGQPPGFAHDGEVALDEPAAASAHLSAPGYRTRIRILPGALDVYRPATTDEGRPASD
ncbi:undecaprenyl-diphosphatase [Agromyces flavus]|uniref:Undecaprenyl-diphosphatase n=1 Tax=Agromyces flavus TaxID=589382 RepID=A0A1H1XHD8_9MICO|nr:phosphatase PAP2 family protein [Agromyces flavus]MCP2366405.1 undecaprenyl-diphosphatase [Agromyces flavus]GGI44612.1 phosphoesterase [Agromyces flavus]SDT08116.1 undecaprenyl-diphosphatase [Agromyces flavus]